MYKKAPIHPLQPRRDHLKKIFFYIGKDVSILVLNILVYVNSRTTSQISPQAAGMDSGGIRRKTGDQTFLAGRLRRRKGRAPAGSARDGVGYVQANPRRTTAQGIERQQRRQLYFQTKSAEAHRR